MGAIGGIAMKAIGVCLRPPGAVCHRTLSFTVVVALSSLLDLCGGSLALDFCLSDPRVALARHLGYVGGSASAVLKDGGGYLFN